MNDSRGDESIFDEHAGHYDIALNRGLSLSGESKVYFAQRRIAWLRDCLTTLGQKPRVVMDFGCGTGAALPLLLDGIGADVVLAIDASAQMLDRARELHAPDRVRFYLADDYRPCGEVDLVFCNGVFHHLSPARRTAASEYVYKALRHGGLFAVWENNPWNPGARWVMKRIPFDRDAVPISSRETRRLVERCGFRMVSTDFLFIFPRWLRHLRPVEPPLSWLPLGAQYQVLCRKPSTAQHEMSGQSE
jgi:SAM-dependent methyltransferase